MLLQVSAGWGRIARWTLMAAAIISYPHFAPQFWVVNIGAYAIVLGIITLSLTFLAAYGGMVSLAQMTVSDQWPPASSSTLRLSSKFIVATRPVKFFMRA